MEGDFWRIVQPGNIFEALTGALPGGPLQALARAREAHPEVARRSERPRYAYVHGNHEIVTAAHGAADELTIGADGLRLLFTHAHQRDVIVRYARWLSGLGVWIGAWVRRIGLGPIHALLRTRAGLRGGPP